MVAAIFRITSIYIIITNVIKIAWLMSSNGTETISAASHLISVSRLNFVAVLLLVAPATIMGDVYAAGPAIKSVLTISMCFVGLARHKFSSQRD